jgi:hypothetical protein
MNAGIWDRKAMSLMEVIPVLSGFLNSWAVSGICPNFMIITGISKIDF